MYIISIILTGILDKYNLLDNIRQFFIRQVGNYINLFSNYQIQNQRQIRYLYIFTLVPIFVVLLLVKIALLHHFLILDLINLILFLLSCKIFAWKNQPKNQLNLEAAINSYAIEFFAPVFWLLVLPTFGPICYMFIMILSSKIKDKVPDNAVYNTTVDKMLFYTNVIPFLVLYFFLAIAGNFEAVLHYILSKKQEFKNKSFYFLESTLHDIILIAEGKNIPTNKGLDEHTEQLHVDTKITEETKPYVMALLYRTGLFFISVLAIIDLTIIMH